MSNKMQNNVILAVAVLSELSRNLKRATYQITTNGIIKRIDESLALLKSEPSDTTDTAKESLTALMKKYPNPFEVERILGQIDLETLTKQEKKDLLDYPAQMLQIYFCTHHWIYKMAEERDRTTEELQAILKVLRLGDSLFTYAINIGDRCTGGEYTKCLEQVVRKKSLPRDVIKRTFGGAYTRVSR